MGASTDSRIGNGCLEAVIAVVLRSYTLIIAVIGSRAAQDAMYGGEIRLHLL